MCNKCVCHMMMPTAPCARLVLIHTDFAFAFFERCLDRPAPATEICQLPCGTHRWCIAQIILHLARRTQGATENCPHTRAWQAVAHSGHAHKGKVCMDRTFTPLLNEEGVPRRLGQRRGQGLHVPCAWGIQFHARMDSRAPQRATPRRFDGRRV